MPTDEYLLKAPLLGFDVFDTLITRALGDPTDVFWYIGAKLRKEGIVSVTPSAYRTLRIWSEKLGRHFADDGEVRIEEFMPLLCRVLGLPIEYTEKLRAYELIEEQKWIRPVPEMVEILAERCRRGLTSILISDTYLSRKDIQDLLTVCGLEIDINDIFVSSEYRCNKASQKLFQKALKHYTVQPQDFVFIGNNFASDVHAPHLMKATAVHFNRTNPTRYESILSRFRGSTRGLSCVMAGASRQTRLAQRNLEAHKEALVRVAAGVIGPVMVGYVNWVLRDALERKFKRLYFFSREGQLLKSIACKLVSKFGMDVECRYLYASRQAWRLPAISTIGDFEHNWILATNGHLTLKRIAARIDVSPDLVAECARRVGVDTRDLERHLSRAETKHLRGMFKGPEVSTILEHASTRRRETLAYLEQEGLFDGTRWGIVDVGWEASLQRCLDSLVLFRNQRVEMGYYFGLRRFATYRSTESRHKAYLFDDRTGSGALLRPFQVVPLIETFLRADHGMTLRYEQQDSRMMPVLREDKTQMVIDWGLYDIHRTVLGFVDELLQSVTDPLSLDLTRRMSAELLKLFWEMPIIDEVKAWGSYPFGADQTGDCWEKLAIPIEPSMWINAVTRQHQPRLHWDLWMLGSATISPPLSAFLTRMLYEMASKTRKIYHSMEPFRLRSRRRRQAILSGK